jgi:hypothetical protein
MFDTLTAMVESMDKETAAKVLNQLADQVRQMGQRPSSADLSQLATRLNEHAAVITAPPAEEPEEEEEGEP